MKLDQAMWRKEIGWTISGLILACSACSRSNNLLLGRVEATVGGHTVVVTDCYRTRVTPPEKVGGPSEQSYRFMPCRDADVLIRNDELIVNGSSYGLLKPADAVTIDHGKVLINELVVPAAVKK
jgi:hypothetical protein